MTHPRIVIVGAGFAGLWAARELMRAPVDVLLVDRNNYHTFLPLLYQVAAAELGPTEIAYPIRSILRRAPNVTFRMAAPTGLDTGRKKIFFGDEEVAWDHLLLAMGATTDDFGIPGVREHAFPLRSIEEAIPLRHHILGCFERAAHESDPEARRRLKTFVIVGAGPTGVEFSGALAELIHGPLRRDYPTLEMREVRILLVEALDGVLRGMPESLSRYAGARLERRFVELRTGTRVQRIDEGTVHFEGGERIATDTVVWTGGVRGVPGPEAWGLPMAPGGRVRVGPTLAVDGVPGVWCAGDLAWFEHDGEPLPGVAPVALQQGTRAAKNILLATAGADPIPFSYRDPGMLAVIGRNAAVARVGGRNFRGFPAWVLWLVVHVARLIGFRNRLLVLVNWAWNYIFFERAVRLILPWARSVPSGEDSPARPPPSSSDPDRDEDPRSGNG